MELTYKVSDLKALISESSNEFKAKIGDGVESEDKKNNGKAYTDAKKRAKEFLPFHLFIKLNQVYNVVNFKIKKLKSF